MGETEFQIRKQLTSGLNLLLILSPKNYQRFSLIDDVVLTYNQAGHFAGKLRIL